MSSRSKKWPTPAISFALAEGPGGELLQLAASTLQPGVWFALVADAGGRFHCSCTGYRLNGACPHATEATAQAAEARP